MNHDSWLDVIKRFCKGRKIIGEKLSDLYKAFEKKHSRSGLSQENFEVGLLILGKNPAKRCQKACIEYALADRKFGYIKFIKEVELVTEGFWKKATAEIHENQFQENAPLPVIPEEPISNKNKDVFINLLPLNWHKMTFTERVDFIQRVKHKGFYDYLLEKDPKLKNYFSKVKKEDPMKLYITVFSFPSGTYSEEAKGLLRCFVDTLNSIGRAQLQFIECKNPDVIEIREMRR